MVSLPRRALTTATLALLLLAASPDTPFSPRSSSARAQSAAREAAASSRTPTGSITGRVTNGSDGIAGIAVELISAQSRYTPQPARAFARTTTDEEGRFRLTGIPAGHYFIRPVAPTFITAGGAPGRAMARTVIVDEGDAVEGINFAMTHGAVITGRVTDAEGRPVIAEMVRLEPLDEQNKQIPYHYFSFDRFGTDDRGIYRIYGLPPGRYRVSVGSTRDENDGMATVRGRRPYLRTFHPNVTDQAEAKIIELSAGTEATGVNITLGSLSEAFKADGRIVDAETGQPLPGVRFSYGPTDRERRYVSAYGAGDRSNQKGEFHIENLAPGYYAAFLMPDTETQQYSDPTVFEVVDGDVSGLEIKVRRAGSLSGVLVVEGTSDRSLRDKLRRLQLFVNMEESQGLQTPMQSLARISADGSFQFTGLPPGKALINMWPSNFDGLSLLRIERDGVKVTDGIELAAGEQATGVRLILSYGTGVMRGRVVSPNGALALPEGMMMNVTLRRTDAEELPGSPGSQPIEVDERGRFLIEGLASGEYEATLRVFQRHVPGNPRPQPPRRSVPPLVQRVSVTSGTQTEITFTLDMDTEVSGGARQ